MKNSELITLLQTFPPDSLVAIDMFSEYCLADASDVRLLEACEPRADGWVHTKRPGRPTQKYVVIG
jgi:hypothetical protein